MELIGDAPDRTVGFLCELDEVHATWSRFAPGRDGADVHIHHEHSDVFYVLAGELTLKRPEGDLVVGPGSFAVVAPLIAHGFANRGDQELRYLNFHVPGTGFADYMRGLREGEKVPFDQFEPPAGHVSPAEPVVTPGRVELDGVVIEAADVEDALFSAHGVSVWKR
jgi:mannose-6-phosphate isomerase-like protein (cupin superfamily)